MTAAMRHSYFRRHAAPEPSHWPVIVFGVLAALDLYLIVTIFAGLWRMWPVVAA